MHLINAPLERTGKTKLAEEVWGGILLGRKTPAQQLSREDVEFDKGITAMLLEGQTLLHLDNIRDRIDSAPLASLLTSTTYQGRVLGHSRMPTLPNNLMIVGTGNNVVACRNGDFGAMVTIDGPYALQPADDNPIYDLRGRCRKCGAESQNRIVVHVAGPRRKEVVAC
jgi:hypothetical protein